MRIVFLSYKNCGKVNLKKEYDREYHDNLTIVEGKDTIARFEDIFPEWERWFSEFGKEIPEIAEKWLESEIVFREKSYHKLIQEI